MRIRKWLLTTVICGGFLAACGGARAAVPEVLKPDSDWAVSKLSTARAKGEPYCALARRFSGDIVLTIARNARDESSVAIDFQHVALSNARDYTISLDPGFGQSRAFSVRAIAGKALVARLGKDYAFHDAMKRSGRVEIDVEGNAYAFDLSGLDEGQRKLGACLVSLTEPAAGGVESAAPEVAAVPVAEAQAQPAAAPDITEGAAQTAPPAMQPVLSEPSVSVAADTGQAEIQVLREENMRLRAALENERRVYEDRLMNEGKDSSKAAELNEKLRLLEIENADLRKRAETAAAAPADSAAADGEIAALEQEVALLREANENLKNTLNTRQDLSAKADAAMERELALLRSENETLKQSVEEQKRLYAQLEKQTAERNVPDPAQEAAIARLRERVDALEKENEALKRAPQTVASGEADGMPAPSLSQIRALEEKLQVVQADRDQLLAKLDETTRGKQKERIDISSDNWNLEQATRRYNEAEIELRRLGRELEQARAQCAVEKKELEYMLFDPDVAEKAQTAKLMDLEKRNADLEEKISALTLEKAENEKRQTADAGYPQAVIEPSAGVVPPAPVESALTPMEGLSGGGKDEAGQEIAMFASAAPPPPAMGGEPGAAVAPESVAGVVPGKGFSSGEDMKNLLGRAHIALSGPVAVSPEGSVPEGSVAYHWDSGPLFGTAEQKAMAAGSGAFDEMAQRYLEKVKGRCDGEFAAVPGTDRKNGDGSRIATYEVACIGAGGSGGASVAVVFHGGNGAFTAISHETGLDDMDAAIDAAENIAAALMEDGRLASN